MFVAEKVLLLLVISLTVYNAFIIDIHINVGSVYHYVNSNEIHQNVINTLTTHASRHHLPDFQKLLRWSASCASQISVKRYWRAAFIY